MANLSAAWIIQQVRRGSTELCSAPQSTDEPDGKDQKKDWSGKDPATHYFEDQHFLLGES